MNQRKLDLLNKRILKDKFYTLVLNENQLEILSKRVGKLKPFWTFNKTLQTKVKKFSLCDKEVSLEYSEKELIDYKNNYLQN